ncbi:MAG: helix-turn-helix transcriptional regulator [Alphaproteobacteria bacterium]|nr:helix-turn-helix transcriptional regulator [Alphaproteobacteria bacterium]
MKTKIKRSSRGRTPSGQPNPIDVHVGNRIRLRRTLLNLSQEKLASLLGLTFQQVQKYERGTNRVGASRLWDIGKVLEVPINFFYDDMDNEVASQSPRMFSIPDATPLAFAEDEEVFNDDPMHRQETLELVKAYYKIPNRTAAKNLFDLAVSMSKTNYQKEKDTEE